MRTCREMGCLSLFASVAVACLTISGTAEAATPAQFVAKLYTEALGRAPDASGWSSRIQNLSSTTCSGATLGVHGKDVLLSSEFDSAGYVNAAKVLLLYRAALDREPNSSELASQTSRLVSGVSFVTLVNEVFNSPEFNQLASKACSGQPYYFNILGYGGYASDLPGVPQLSEADIQGRLNAASPGSSVSLPSMAVIRLTAPLIIPAGVSLTTEGNPSPNAHGKMARLVRDPSFGAGQALVQIRPGARLTSVWVDGQRGAAGYNGTVAQPFVHDEINIQALSGAGTSVSNNFISNTAGWSSLQMFGHAETGVQCSAAQITGNVITAYSSNNLDNVSKSWADGISDSCEESTVSGNQIVDASDGGIVLFRAQTQAGGAIQHSQVTDNVILNAGNSAYLALGVDPLYQTGGCPITPSFAGSYVGRNVFWTGPNATIEIGLAVGTAEWFFSNGGCLGTGANVSDNSSNGFRVRVNDGIAVQGMLNATVQSNNLLTTRVAKGRCVSYDVSAGVSAGIASGSIQSYVNAALKVCI